MVRPHMLYPPFVYDISELCGYGDDDIIQDRYIAVIPSQLVNNVDDIRPLRQTYASTFAS